MLHRFADEGAVPGKVRYAEAVYFAPFGKEAALDKGGFVVGAGTRHCRNQVVG